MDDTAGIRAARQSVLRAGHHDLVEDAVDAIWVHDLEGRLTYLNRAAERLFGMPREVLLGSDVFECAEGLRAQSMGLQDDAVIEFDLARDGGDTVPVEASLRLLHVEGEPASVQVIARDIGLRRQRTEAIQHRALHDPLTDIPNRALLEDRISQSMRISIRTGRPFVVLLVDLDGFKEVNDTHGHHVGDDVLREVAVRLKSVLRASDTCARYGGDEFVIVLPETDADGGAIVARKIEEALAPPVRTDEVTLGIGASSGIAVYPDHRDDERPFDVRSLLSRADAAMYVAKRSGRAWAVYGSPARRKRRRLRAVPFPGGNRDRFWATSAAALAAAVLTAVVMAPSSPVETDGRDGSSLPWAAGPHGAIGGDEGLLEIAADGGGTIHRLIQAASRAMGSAGALPWDVVEPDAPVLASAAPGGYTVGRPALALPPSGAKAPPPQGDSSRRAPDHGSPSKPVPPPSSGDHHADPSPPHPGGSSKTSKKNPAPPARGESSDGTSHAPGGSASRGGGSPPSGASSPPKNSGNSSHGGSSSHGKSSHPSGNGSPSAGHPPQNGSPGNSGHKSSSGHGSSPGRGSSSGHGSSPGHGAGGPPAGHQSSGGGQPSGGKHGSASKQGGNGGSHSSPAGGSSGHSGGGPGSGGGHGAGGGNSGNGRG